MVNDFRATTQVATFLFGEEIPAYLAEIDRKGLKAWLANEEYQKMADDPKRGALVIQHTKLLGWLNNQLPELTKVFASYLRFNAWI